MKPHRAWAALLLASALWSRSAAAQSSNGQGQPWLGDRRYGEGIGIRTGNLELHPGIAGEVGYDSNYFQRSGEVSPTVNEPVMGALRLRITPSLSLSTLGGQRSLASAGQGAPPGVTIRGGISASYNEFFATQSQYSSQVSQQRDVAGNADLALQILPQRPWGGDLSGGVSRMIQPSNSPDTQNSFDRDTLRAAAGIRWQPGGGLFMWRLGYAFTGNMFEDKPFQVYDNVHHAVQTNGRWTFLPRTALVYKGELEFMNYTAGPKTQNNAAPIRSMLGLNGLISNHFALLAMAGWEATFYKRSMVPAQNYDGMIGQAELTWFLMARPDLDPEAASIGLSSIAAGYTRWVANSYLGDYFLTDRVYGNFSYLTGGRFLLSAVGGYSRVNFPTSFFADGTVRQAPFGQDRVDVTGFAEYRTSDTVGINTTLRYNANLTATHVPLAEASPLRDNLAFNRWEVYLGARFFM